IGGARQGDMAHFGFRREVEQLLIDLVAGQRGKGERRHEAAARLGQDGPHGRAALAQAAYQLEGLVSRDAPADDEKDTLSAEVQAPLRKNPLSGRVIHRITVRKCSSKKIKQKRL